MDTVRSLFENEAALAVAVVESVLVVAVAFGFDLDGPQIASLVALLVPLGGLLTRSQVWKPQSVEAEKGKAYDRGVDAGRTELRAAEDPHEPGGALGPDLPQNDER